ncbi:SUMF1/EgtB/PvdO family nonheme iron enzyme [Aquitalea magnusonii]|uniref:SUMF1/EgtB/PvdO family nonheme iron enzyme n=1 Tax=Aquitalea magnusonii TaxID=332411 RepID=UPI001379F652|nr:SUMF1/EgtB/PvdO family nonheme iron enzyme [Aquitalea magnusonii]
MPGGTLHHWGADDAYPGRSTGATRSSSKASGMDRHEVSNAQFARFVGAPPAIAPWPSAGWMAGTTLMCQPGCASPAPWCSSCPAGWTRTKSTGGTLFPAPTGGSRKGRAAAGAAGNHPVVHIAREDAMAYARWAGRSLPTEAEFEYAARGAVASRFPWGDSLQRQGRQMANTWQGPFPFKNNTEDGFAATAPVGCFAANGYGLFDLIGNVWEWTADDWSTPLPAATAQPALNLEAALSLQARGSKLGTIKGGSFLCSPLYCQRYRPSARHAQELSLGSSHIGFRTVAYAPGPAGP